MSEEKMKVPVFDGHYEHWSEMMENLLRAKRLWHLIEPGIQEPEVGVAVSENQRKKLEELREKDLKVKHYLYQAIDRVTFEQILDRKSSRAVWDQMKRRFAGNERVKRSTLQRLRRDFEVMEMKSNEIVAEYFARVLSIANQMRSNGETMPDVKVVEKILRTLSEKYLFVVVSIEESRDVQNMTIDELQSTLLVHEQKFKKTEKEEEQALKVEDYSNSRGRGRGRGGYRGRGRGRGRSTINKETVECYNCHKLGHFQYECPSRKETNYVEFDEDEEMMFMATIVDEQDEEERVMMVQESEEKRNNLWFLDSGCSNHMCGIKERFSSLDSSVSHTVKLGNNTRLTVHGKGNVKFVLNGATYIVQEVCYIPDLKNNLLSIGQLQQRGLAFLIQSDYCKIFHPDRGLIFQCKMSKNRLFPLVEDSVGKKDEVEESCMYTEDTYKLWHMRYGHLSKSSFETMQNKEMVLGVPKVTVERDIYTHCCTGKQHRSAIPKKSQWRAKERLELIHSDICGPISPPSITGKMRQLTTSFTPQQNGVAERKNRTVMNMVVTMLVAKSMSKVFWAEAATWTFHVLNRSPTKALLNMTPQEVWSGTKPTVDCFRVWGCLAHVHVLKEKRTKLDDKSITCILMGLSNESKAYRLLNPTTMKIIISRDVIFEEHKEWEWNGKSSDQIEQKLKWESDDGIQERWETSDDEDAVSQEVNDHSNPSNVTNTIDSSVATGVREGRQRRPPRYLSDYITGDDELNVVEELVHAPDPTTYEETCKYDKWRLAMDVEIEAIKKNKTWDLVELPLNTKCIGVKWVYKTKVNEKGEIEKHKARLVAKGYCQEHGIDYLEVYAPVARMDTIRMMIAVAAQKGWHLYQMDVKSAFLHVTLEEDVYVQQPQGYVIKNEEDKVYKLKKALYGLKQAPRAWFSRIESYFVKEGFTRSNSEYTLFIKKNAQGNILIINVYVDDLIYTGDDDVMLRDFKDSMMNEFEMSDLGRMRFFLGIEVTQTSLGIHISQQKYVREVLRRFCMEDCNPTLNPMVPGIKLTVDDEGTKLDTTRYKQMVGSLMYATITRPDIQFDVNLGTSELGIWYDSKGEGKLEVFTDSDFAGDTESRKSTSGYVFMWNGGAFAWLSKKQDIVALSSTEAEYVAAATYACQAVWVKEMLEEMGISLTESIAIMCDNTSTIKLSKNPVFHGRCKHIGVRFHFLRDLVKEGTITLEYCGTREQLADALTKPLGRDQFAKLRKKMGIYSVKDKLDESQSSLREGLKE